jgi:hypothetical protein
MRIAPKVRAQSSANTVVSKPWLVRGSSDRTFNQCSTSDSLAGRSPCSCRALLRRRWGTFARGSQGWPSAEPPGQNSQRCGCDRVHVDVLSEWMLGCGDLPKPVHNDQPREFEHIHRHLPAWEEQPDGVGDRRRHEVLEGQDPKLESTRLGRGADHNASGTNSAVGRYYKS